MNPDRWRRINTIFQDAIARRAQERGPFLVNICAGDVELRQEVARLVQAHERATGFLEQADRKSVV